MFRPLLATICVVFIAVSAHAQPTVVESDWTLVQSIDFARPMSAVYNHADNLVYVLRREGTNDGVYRVNRQGFASQVVVADRPAALMVNEDGSALFYSEDFGGGIYRVDLGTDTGQLWVAGWHGGDDDPVGMAFAPSDHTGPLMTPGQAVMVDRGFNGPDELWLWSTLVAEGESVLHVDDGTLNDGTDVAVDATSIFVVDPGIGAIYEVAPDSSLIAFPTSQGLADPLGIDIDPLNGDLLVLDGGTARVVRVDRGTGTVTDMLTNVSAGLGWAGLDVSPDGRFLIVTARQDDAVYVYGRCGAGLGSDCNDNGVDDACETWSGAQPDCNANLTPDSCDIGSGASEDCNLDGVPDECPSCPPVEVVFIMDTSSSMDDEAAALCNDFNAVVAALDAANLTVQASLLGICNLPGGAYSCLEDHVINLFGTEVPGNPPPGLEELGDCPGGLEVCLEDWARAVAVTAGAFPWSAPGASVRLIVPVSDEGSYCGDPVTQEDQDLNAHAIDIAVAEDVIVSPITGTGSSGAVLALAQAMADSTRGQVFSSTEPGDDIGQGIVDLVTAACTAASDCNDNGTLDECDISSGTSTDLNENGTPDECETTSVGPVPTLQRTVAALESYPNPFNPNVTIRFELARSAWTEVAVYSLDGRVVRTLLGERLDPGSRTLSWDGIDDEGRNVASGVYYARIVADGDRRTVRMVLVK